jgi:hypothetical protein
VERGGTAGIAGAANANSYATTINGNAAQAQSAASGSSGQAQAVAQSNFGSVNSIQTVATSQVGGTGSATALAQVGGSISLPNAINAGQSFATAIPFVAGPFMVALGSMGAGGVGASSFAYSQSVNFTFNAIGAPFQIGLLGSTSLGTGFDSALLQIFDNGNLVVNQSFANLAAAQAYFFNRLIDIQLAAGFHTIQLAFNEMMTGGEGFAFDFAGSTAVSATPLPPSWTMLLIGFVGFGFFVYRRQRKEAAFAAW